MDGMESPYYRRFYTERHLTFPNSTTAQWHLKHAGQKTEYGHGHHGECGDSLATCSIASVVEEAETEGDLIKVPAIDIVLLDRVVDVIAEMRVQGSTTATLVRIRWNVCSASRSDGGQTVPGHHLSGALSFDDLYADVILVWAGDA